MMFPLLPTIHRQPPLHPLEYEVPTLEFGQHLPLPRGTVMSPHQRGIIPPPLREQLSPFFGSLPRQPAKRFSASRSMVCDDLQVPDNPHMPVAQPLVSPAVFHRARSLFDVQKHELTSLSLSPVSSDSFDNNSPTAALLNPQQPVPFMSESSDIRTATMNPVRNKTFMSSVSDGYAHTAKRSSETSKVFVCPYCNYAIPVRVTTGLGDFMKPDGVAFRTMQRHCQDQHGAVWESHGNVLPLKKVLGEYKPAVSQTCMRTTIVCLSQSDEESEQNSDVVVSEMQNDPAVSSGRHRTPPTDTDTAWNSQGHVLPPEEVLEKCKPAVTQICMATTTECMSQSQEVSTQNSSVVECEMQSDPAISSGRHGTPSTGVDTCTSSQDGAGWKSQGNVLPPEEILETSKPAVTQICIPATTECMSQSHDKSAQDTSVIVSEMQSGPAISSGHHSSPPADTDTSSQHRAAWKSQGHVVATAT